MKPTTINLQEEYIPQTTEQSVDPLGDNISSLSLVRVSGSDLEVVNAARVSYGKVSTQLSDRDRVLIKFLMDHDHTSPFEHNQLSFRVKAPIYVARQWMRHRINSYNEISYRYVKAPLEFYIPAHFRKQDTKNKQSSFGQLNEPQALEIYQKSLQQTYQAYEALLQAGVCREQARGVLPLCTYTEFIYTCNLNALMHFIRLRTHEGAQFEIKRYAQEMFKLAYEHFPASLDAFKAKLDGRLDGLVEKKPREEHAEQFAKLLT
jgi:thymidylate synthase (FAD)